MPEETMGGMGAILEDELALARRSVAMAQAMILVEGESDRRALEVLAVRLDRDLDAEGVVIVAIAGATNIARFLAILPTSVGLCGLYDEAEGHILRSALEPSEPGLRMAEEELAARGFFMCRRDLEEELIRSVGVAGVLEVIDRSGDIDSWRLFSDQPAQRDRPITARLRRFLGTKSGRKIEYAGLLAERLDLSRQSDSPLLRVLSHTR
ncbi:MAG: ATP-dependent endonuclease [Acidimicrobiia bacterium]|jgi:hypothetical protein